MSLFVARFQSLSVESLLADTSMRESEEKETLYTGPTWPRREAMNLGRKESGEESAREETHMRRCTSSCVQSAVRQHTCGTHFPVLPSHSLTELSHPQDAMSLPLGLKATWQICFWWPVSLARGFLGLASVRTFGHRKRV